MNLKECIEICTKNIKTGMTEVWTEECVKALETAKQGYGMC